MKTPTEHLVYLQRRDFVPGSPRVYTKDEFAVLRGFGHADDKPPVSSPYTDSEALSLLRALVARGRVLSSFADSVIRRVEERKPLSRKQLDAVHRLVLGDEDKERNREARVITGQSRKYGSHRWTG